MNRYIILLAAAALLSAGCDKISDKVSSIRKSEISQKMSSDQKLATAQEAAAKARAKLAAKIAARVAARASGRTAGGPVNSEALRAAGELVGMLCSSPKFMDDVESNLDLLEALSGEGGDRNEVKRQFRESQKRYCGMLAKTLPSRGATYAGFTQYAMNMLPNQATADQRLKFKTLIKEKCPRGDQARLEKTAGGLMSYCAADGPQ